MSLVKAGTSVVGIESDGLFPPREVKEMAALIPGAVYHEITSDFGHDGFLLENDQLTSIIKPIIDRL